MRDYEIKSRASLITMDDLNEAKQRIALKLQAVNPFVAMTEDYIDALRFKRDTIRWMKTNASKVNFYIWTSAPIVPDLPDVPATRIGLHETWEFRSTWSIPSIIVNRYGIFFLNRMMNENDASIENICANNMRSQDARGFPSRRVDETLSNHLMRLYRTIRLNVLMVEYYRLDGYDIRENDVVKHGPAFSAEDRVRGYRFYEQVEGSEIVAAIMEKLRECISILVDRFKDYYNAITSNEAAMDEMSYSINPSQLLLLFDLWAEKRLLLDEHMIVFDVKHNQLIQDPGRSLAYTQHDERSGLGVIAFKIREPDNVLASFMRISYLKATLIHEVAHLIEWNRIHPLDDAMASDQMHGLYFKRAYAWVIKRAKEAGVVPRDAPSGVREFDTEEWIRSSKFITRLEAQAYYQIDVIDGHGVDAKLMYPGEFASNPIEIMDEEEEEGEEEDHESDENDDDDDYRPRGHKRSRDDDSDDESSREKNKRRKLKSLLGSYLADLVIKTDTTVPGLMDQVTTSLSGILLDPSWPAKTPMPTIAWTEALMQDARDAITFFDSEHLEVWLRGSDLAIIDGKNEPTRLNTVTFMGRLFSDYVPLPGQSYEDAFNDVVRLMATSNHLTGKSIARWVGEWTTIDRELIADTSSAPHVYFARVSDQAPQGLTALLQSGSGVVIKSVPLLTPGRFGTISSFFVDVLFSLRFRDDVVRQLIPFTPHFAIGIDAFADEHREQQQQQYKYRIYLVSERAHVSVADSGPTGLNAHMIQTFQTWFSFEGGNRIEGFSHNDAHGENRMLRSVEGTPFANRNWLYARPMDTHSDPPRIGLFRIPASAHQNQLVEIIDFGRSMASRPYRQAPPRNQAMRDAELQRLRKDMIRSLSTYSTGNSTALRYVFKEDPDLYELRRRLDTGDRAFMDEWATMKAFQNAGVEFVGFFDDDDLADRLLPDDILVAKQALVTPDAATDAKFMRLVTEGVLAVAHPFMKSKR
jgi:hypothetical protein